MTGGSTMVPGARRCPEARAHYAHDWYTPLRTHCPGGPEENPTAPKRMTVALFQTISKDAWKLVRDIDPEMPGDLTEDEKGAFEIGVIAGIRATCEAFGVAAVPVMPT